MEFGKLLVINCDGDRKGAHQILACGDVVIITHIYLSVPKPYLEFLLQGPQNFSFHVFYAAPNLMIFGVSMHK